MRNKQELRTDLLRSRMSFSPVQLEKNQDLLLIKLQQLDLPFLQFIHTYLPIFDRNEPDPAPMIRWLQFSNPGLQIIVPKLIDKQTLVHVHISDETKWITNSWGIEEPKDGTIADPADIDLVFVPLLGFDKSGNRIGYGKGFYDRFLKECRPDALKIGLSFLPPIEESFQPDPWDFPLDYCLTPNEIYAFT